MSEQPHHNPGDPKPAAAPTEARFLRDQADEASAAISGALAALKADLAKGADPRAWAHEHPWVAVGAAAVAGFAAASALVPSKDEQALKKLQRIERALRPAESTPGQSAAQRSAAPDSSPPKSLTTRLFSEIFSTLQPMLTSAFAAYAAAPSSHNGNGHSPAAASTYHQQESDFDQA